jgi:hypothetical protein
VADDLKTRVLELAEIARACPENLQEKCFELLLQDLLREQSGRARPPAEAVQAGDPAEELAEENPTEGQGAPQGDLGTGDVHVKVRRFLEKYNLDLNDLNQIFYKQGAEILPLYEDLRTTRMAESQIRIALLLALRTAIATGDFEFDGEAVRSETQARKSYDQGNFTSNFKASKSLFDGFEKYEKKSPVVKLSEDGRRELAELIRELG